MRPAAPTVAMDFLFALEMPDSGGDSTETVPELQSLSCSFFSLFALQRIRPRLC